MAGTRRGTADVRIDEVWAWLPYTDDSRFRWNCTVALTASGAGTQAAVEMQVLVSAGTWYSYKAFGETISATASNGVQQAWLRAATQAFMYYDGKSANDVWGVARWHFEMVGNRTGVV